MIGLHAVQFGNSWLRKIPWTAKVARVFADEPPSANETFSGATIFVTGTLR